MVWKVGFICLIHDTTPGSRAEPSIACTLRNPPRTDSSGKDHRLKTPESAFLLHDRAGFSRLKVLRADEELCAEMMALQYRILLRF